jgi:hypothetical protein
VTEEEGVLVVPTQTRGPSAKEQHRLQQQQIFVKYKVRRANGHLKISWIVSK